jgi:serine/threonine protein kinase
VNPAVPGPLSEIILHLLEKEPDSRYQTADGLIYDLERAQDIYDLERAQDIHDLERAQDTGPERRDPRR